MTQCRNDTLEILNQGHYFFPTSIFSMVLFVSLVKQILMEHSTFQRRIKMKKGQQQIRCSSGASIAGRIDSLLQVIRLFFFLPVMSSPLHKPTLFNQAFVHVTCTLRLMDF